MPGAQLAAQAGNADHEEFIKIVGRDRKEADALKQRMTLVGRFLQDATVEMQPGQLPVDETGRASRKVGFAIARRLGRLRRLFHRQNNGLSEIHRDNQSVE